MARRLIARLIANSVDATNDQPAAHQAAAQSSERDVGSENDQGMDSDSDSMPDLVPAEDLFEDEDEDDIGEAHPPPRGGWPWQPHSTRRPTAEHLFKDCRRLPVPPVPVAGPIAHDVNAATAGVNIRSPCIPGLDAGYDASHHGRKTRGQKRQLQQQLPGSGGSSSDGPRTRSCTSAASAASSGTTGALLTPGTSSAAAGTAHADPKGGGGGGSAKSNFTVVNTARMLLKRELALGDAGGFSRPQQRHLCCYRHLPTHPAQMRDEMRSRAYIGQYSADGRFFVAAFQDRRVRLYDTEACWRLRKDVTTRMMRWTITDTTISPDQRFLVYSSISPVAYMVHVGGPLDLVESQANVTEIHEPLNFQSVVRRREGGVAGDSSGSDDGGANMFGIWSVSWSPAGGEIIAGTNDQSVYILDVEKQRRVARLHGHSDDVNATAYVDPMSPNMIASGSDDNDIKIWDRRLASSHSRTPVGVLQGHTQGLTHLSAKGDGRYLLSNSKDQTLKLWDVRRMVTAGEVRRQPPVRPRFSWDYRWETYPAAQYEILHPHDTSVSTYRGHKVLHTLIRGYFSPEHTTGQRFIYAGSASGSVHIWDLVSGRQVAQLRHHGELVRDVSWHPSEPEITSVSWDGRVLSWAPGDEAGGAHLPPTRGDQHMY